MALYFNLCVIKSSIISQARSQAEAMKPGLQHEHLTLFIPKICSYDIKWAGAQHFLQDDISAKQRLRSACANAQADRSHYFALISEISKLSLDERQMFCLECIYAQADLNFRWAHINL